MQVWISAVQLQRQLRMLIKGVRGQNAGFGSIEFTALKRGYCQPTQAYRDVEVRVMLTKPKVKKKPTICGRVAT
jgi:hypothetical protein